jgi:hypothetical protein
MKKPIEVGMRVEFQATTINERGGTDLIFSCGRVKAAHWNGTFEVETPDRKTHVITRRQISKSWRKKPKRKRPREVWIAMMGDDVFGGTYLNKPKGLDSNWEAVRFREVIE